MQMPQPPLVRSVYPPLPTLTVLEILDRTFRIYRDNFLAFIGLSAAVIVPITIFTTVLTLDSSARILELNERSTFTMSPSQSSAYLSEMLGLFAVIMLITFATVILQQVFLNGPLTYMASESHLGNSVSLGQAFAATRGAFGKLGGALTLIYLIIIGLSVLLTFIFFACGLGFGILLYLWIAMYGFVVPVLVLERLTMGQGMNRAWALARWRFWPLFWLIAGITLLGTIFTIALSILQALLIEPAASLSYETSTLISTVLQTSTNIFLAPLLPTGLTLMYYDTRVRLEGLDFAMRLSSKPHPRPADVGSPVPFGPFMEGRDVGNMMILSVVLLVVVVVLYTALLAIAFSLMGSMFIGF